MKNKRKIALYVFLVLAILAIIGVYYVYNQVEKHVDNVVIVDDKGNTLQDYYQEVDLQVTNNLLTIELIYDGKPYVFEVDTGAGFVISKQFVKEAKLGKPINSVKDNNAVGKVSKVDEYYVDRINIGGLNFSNMKAQEVWAVNMSSILGSPYGTIGYEVLRGSRYVQLNPALGKLIFSSDLDKLDYIQNASKINFNYKQGDIIPMRDMVLARDPISEGIYINGINNPKTAVVYDSGNSVSPFTLPGALYDKYKDKNNTYNFRAHASVDGGSADVQLQKSLIKSIKIADIELKNVVVTRLNAIPVVDLGAQAMKHLVITFDWGQVQQQESVYISAANNKVIDLMPKDVYGFGPQFEDNKVVVGMLIASGSAARNGLKFNDQILKWSGVDVSNITAKEFRATFFDPKTAIQPFADYIDSAKTTSAPLTLTFKDKDGNVETITIMRENPFSMK